ncbi:diguanylate cyclase [Oceanirhabdus seepicola]|uniref:Cache domain-containing protein n=1 Tax=Oceanirhabdus seepicola TaxID=2828781 RepID=A0A9J6NXV7_9CLOT|nr:diguanylate cyclase [Oceanirhabdus seepicola]MCM1989099.1 cache domain-containing protein [Oceanirhabdus seepicola]
MRKLGFSKQIMLLLMSLVIICTVLTEVISYSMTSKLNNNLVMNNLQTLTESTYNLIDSSVNASIKNHLRAIAEKNKNIVELYYEKFMTGELSELEAKQAVESILKSQSIGETGYIYIVDSTGVLIEHPVLKGVNISSYDFIQRQIDKKDGYMEYLWKNPEDEIARDKVLYMTYFEPWDYIISISSYKSEFINLVNTNDFKDNILSVTIGKTGYMHVMNSSGNLIIHPKQEGVSIYNYTDTEGNYFIQEIIQKKNGSITYPWKNPGEEGYKDKIVIYKYYEPMDWYLCSGVYIDEIIEPIEQMKKRLFTVFCFIFSLSALIALIYSRIILYPIKQLIKATEKVIGGEFDVRIKSNRNDEIGELTKIFNDMIYRIKNYMEELKISNSQLEEINTTLEKKVKDRTRQLELLSNQDGLTGLFNRRKLDEYLEQAWIKSLEYKEPLAIVMIDIDHFKGYNDTYGHPAGDDCLKMVARTIKEMLRKEIDFVARYGGEEFLAVLKNTDQDTALSLAEQVRKGIEDLKIPHSASKISNYVTISIGVCTLNRFANNDLKTFIELTDEALYKAKTEGRNQVKVHNY